MKQTCLDQKNTMFILKILLLPVFDIKCPALSPIYPNVTWWLCAFNFHAFNFNVENVSKILMSFYFRLLKCFFVYFFQMKETYSEAFYLLVYVRIFQHKNIVRETVFVFFPLHIRCCWVFCFWLPCKKKGLLYFLIPQ